MAGLNKVTVDDINVKGKKVLVRVDFNVPLKDGVITNDNRITAALPTIKKLVADGGKVVLCSHLGKPKNGPEAKFSLAPAAARLAELLPETKVTFAADDTVVGDNAKKAVAEMADGDIVVLENTRFRGAEETKNGEAFAKELADLVDDESSLRKQQLVTSCRKRSTISEMQLKHLLDHSLLSSVAQR